MTGAHRRATSAGSCNSNTFAARAGRWSAQHRKKAICGWIAFVVDRVRHRRRRRRQEAAPTRTTTSASRARPTACIDDHFPKQDDETVIVQAPKGGKATDAGRARGGRRHHRRRLGASPASTSVKSPLREGQRGPDLQGRPLRARELQAPRRRRPRPSKRVDPIDRRRRQGQGANPNVFVGQFGGASANKALSKAFEDDFKKAEIALAADHADHPHPRLRRARRRRRPAAARPDRRRWRRSASSRCRQPDRARWTSTVSSVILLVGLAVGVDYTLFYLRREREEQARGAPASARRSHIAAATSGRAVLISGLTVMVAMAGMFLAGDEHLHRARRRRDHGRRRRDDRLGHRRARRARRGSATASRRAASRSCTRLRSGERREPRLELDPRPRAAAPGCSRPSSPPASCSSLALPAFGMHTVLTGTDDLPRKLEVMQVYDRDPGRVPGRADPGRRRPSRPRTSRRRRSPAAIKELERQARSPPGTMQRPGRRRRSAADKHVASIAIPMKGDGTDDVSDARARRRCAAASCRRRSARRRASSTPT